MNAAEIISANPHFAWRQARIGEVEGLIGTAPDGAEQWVIWLGDRHVSGPMPWSREAIQAGLLNLHAARMGDDPP
jgi:hypothetical protein